MEKYNYYEAVKEDVKNYINGDHHDDIMEMVEKGDSRDDIAGVLYDELFIDDSVTGNASGSYTFSTWLAEENICHNLDLLAEACEEFGNDCAKLLSDGAEACDVTIRCYLLSQAIWEVLEEDGIGEA